jgi:hypothetical protein
MELEPTRHKIGYGIGREPEGRFDLCVELEPDSGVSSKWEENQNQTEVFLKIRSGFLFKVSLGIYWFWSFCSHFASFPLLWIFCQTSKLKLARFLFSSVQAQHRSLGGFFFIVCSREVKHQSSKGIYFSNVVCSRFEENSNIKTWEENFKRKFVKKKSIVDSTSSLPLFVLSLVFIVAHDHNLLPTLPCGHALWQ